MGEREIKSDIRTVLYEAPELQQVLNVLRNKALTKAEVEDVMLQEQIAREWIRRNRSAKEMYHVQRQPSTQAHG